MTTTIDTTRLDAFLSRAVSDMAAAESAVACYVGDRLGLYRAMAGKGPMTAADLASATATNERLVLEWLRNQAAGGYVDHDGDVFTLPAEHAAVLADESSPVFVGGLFDVVASMWADADAVQGAFRGDGGLDWGAHDERLYEGVERLFGPIYRANLTSVWLPALGGVVDRLEAGGRVADVGCGSGTSTILMASAFPQAEVVGYDRHAGSIETARRRAAAAGLDGRLRFETRDAADLPSDRYDLVCFFDCLHDMGDPVSAAASARRGLGDRGVLMVVEPRAADNLTENENPVSRLYYAGSVFLCTPSALAQNGRHALGAQAGPAAITDVLRQAGFDRVRVAVETPFNLVFEAR